MARASLSEHMKEQRARQGQELANSGPFVTISRQFGCHGFSLGLLLLEILNEETEGAAWRIYHKDILARLATETNLAAGLIEQERRSKPSMIVDFFRSLKKDRMPSGYEIRNRITVIIRGLAVQGHAIIIGQGGAGATQDLPNGLTVRLEAPEEWRIKQVAFREGINEAQARQLVREKESEREYLRKLYETRFPRKSAFHITYDCSAFPLAHIAQHIAHMMRLTKCV